jgi:hypothetical protein
VVVAPDVPDAPEVVALDVMADAEPDALVGVLMLV